MTAPDASGSMSSRHLNMMAGVTKGTVDSGKRGGN